MALKIITEECIQCDVCRSECPNGAIYDGEEGLVIEAALCTECVGYFDESRCAAGCPTFSIVPDPEHAESREELESKFQLIAEMMNTP